jgi:hypothetical protein
MPDPDVLDRLFGELAAADMPVPAPGSIVARGRQRRRRARGGAVTAAAAIAVIVVGAMQWPRIHPGEPGLQQQTRSSVCAAAPDAALNSELSSPLPASRQQSVSGIGLSANHEVLYLFTTAAGFHGIAAESVATGAISQKIPPVHMPPWISAQGGLGPDGDVVVRTLNASVQTNGSEFWSSVLVFSPRTIAWSATGQAAVLEPAGEVSSALSAPVFGGSAHQLVAWEALEWTPNSHVRQIVEADLLTGVTNVVASGYVGAPVFVGNALVWPIASSAAGPYHMVAASASDFPARQRVAVPLPLRKAGSAIGIVSSGGAVAYASADLTRLFYAPSQLQPAMQVLRLTDGDYLAPDGLAIGPGYLAWSTAGAASFVASAKTLAATRITDGNATFGLVQGLGGDVFVTRSTDPKSGSRSLYLLRGSVIGGLTCATPRHAPG